MQDERSSAEAGKEQQKSFFFGQELGQQLPDCSVRLVPPFVLLFFLVLLLLDTDHKLVYRFMFSCLILFLIDSLCNQVGNVKKKRAVPLISKIRSFHSCL